MKFSNPLVLTDKLTASMKSVAKHILQKYKPSDSDNFLQGDKLYT